MALRKINFIENEIYHIYNRGNSKREIFHDREDYERFRKMLYLCNGNKKFHFKDLAKLEKKDIYSTDRGDNLVKILAYVMMPNHFHIMVYPLANAKQKNRVNKNLDNNMSVFIRRLTGAYTMYYNRKYNRTGSLFEGRFKAEHINTHTYFKYLFSYIHLNPIKILQKDWKEAGIKNVSEALTFLHTYKYSSFHDYFSPSVPYGGIIHKEGFLSKVETGTDLTTELLDWLKFKTIT